MTRAIFVDPDKCIGCYACVVACSVEHDLPPRPAAPPVGSPEGLALIRIEPSGSRRDDGSVGQFFRPILCRHCPEAPCIGECPTSAISRDVESGVTLVNREECTGCELCLPVCPYGAPQFYDGKMYLCDLCLGRLGEGRQTACQAACPAGTIHVGSTDEISALIAEKDGRG